MITQKTDPARASDVYNTASAEHEASTEEFSQFVTCHVDGEEFAVDILSVQEIIRMVEITRVPKSPSFVEGVINLRGRIIPVLDLRRRLGVPEAARTAQSRIVVVMVRGRVVGLVVDSVSEVLRIPKSAMEPAPSLGATVGAEFIQGVGRLEDRLLTLLDLKRLLLPTDGAVSEAA
ncbi:MAG: chemotaxis protein CheW [Nitrospirae bacterium]|nr:MAG: chemotaxis protein CheW [Nitrospirota bacterium]